MSSNRREFLRGSAAAAGLVALTCGLPARAFRTADTVRPQHGSGRREFLAAIAAGDVEAVRDALERDPALLDMSDGAGRSVFAVALLHRHADVADLLRERGHAPDLHESALALDWERFAALAERDPVAVNRDHPIGGTAMYAGAIGGAATSIWRVYAEGGDPNRSPRGHDGQSAVRAALDHPDLNTAELTAASMLGNGALPNGAQVRGSTPLHAAAARGSAAIVEVLIRKGADLAATDDEGRTPLELARSAGQRETARLLERHDTIPRDHSTSRTLYDASGDPYRAPDITGIPFAERGGVVGSSHGNLDAVRVAVEAQPLLVHSVATTTEGAVEAGAHMGRVDIVDFLLDHGAPYSLPTALMRGDVATCKRLLDEDPLRVHERGAHDFAMLWYPIIGRGHLELAELLIAHGAEVERQHWLGTTALHYAAIGGQIEMAELLIANGADVNRVGRKFGGRPLTPLDLATAREQTATIELLKANGASEAKGAG